MMWPFKKKAPPAPFSEFAAQQPAAPCGDQETHYQYHLNGVRCPLCAAIAARKAKDAELDSLADKIAARLRPATPTTMPPELAKLLWELFSDHRDWEGVRQDHYERAAQRVHELYDFYRSTPAAPMLTTHQQYWLDRRGQIIEALEAEGLQILSDKDRVWLGKLTKGREPVQEARRD